MLLTQLYFCLEDSHTHFPGTPMSLLLHLWWGFFPIRTNYKCLHFMLFYPAYCSIIMSGSLSHKKHLKAEMCLIPHLMHWAPSMVTHTEYLLSKCLLDGWQTNVGICEQNFKSILWNIVKFYYFRSLKRSQSQKVFGSSKNTILKKNIIPNRNSQSMSRGDDSQVEPICYRKQKWEHT